MNYVAHAEFAATRPLREIFILKEDRLLKFVQDHLSQHSWFISLVPLDTLLKSVEHLQLNFDIDKFLVI